MTIEGALTDLQNLIDNDLIPFWAKPSLKKVKETVEMEIGERKTGKWILIHPLQEDDDGAYECSCCKSGSWEVDPTTWKACPWCTALMEVEDGKDVLTAMKESAEAVKNSPHYDFSCVTSLFREEDEQNVRHEVQ